jgi:hypothetical protein
VRNLMCLVSRISHGVCKQCSCGFIVDYRIWVPSIENNDNLLKSSRFTTSEQTVMRKCMFFFLVFLSPSSETCIVYCEDTHRLLLSNAATERLYILNLRMFSITSSSVRASVFSQFGERSLTTHDSSTDIIFDSYSWTRRSIYHVAIQCSLHTLLIRTRSIQRVCRANYDWTERNPSEGRRCFVVRQVDEWQRH